MQVSNERITEMTHISKIRDEIIRRPWNSGATKLFRTSANPVRRSESFVHALKIVLDWTCIYFVERDPATAWPGVRMETRG